MKKQGRPTKMTPEVQDEILAEIAQGKSLVKILSSSQRYPDYTNFCKYLKYNEDFRQRYAHAREEQADYIAEESRDIADDSANLICDGYDNARVQAAKLRVDTRKWFASKLKPKVYGDKVDNPGSGVNILIAPSSTTEDRIKILQSTGAQLPSPE